VSILQLLTSSESLESSIAEKMASVLPFTVSNAPRLISSTVCPFVHRVTLSLSAKGALEQQQMAITQIDLKNKPAWFLELWPKGNVPIVVLQDERNGERVVLNESQVLIDYVDETFKDHPLFPASPADRARIRITCSRYNENIVPLWYKLLMSKDKESAVKLGNDYQEELKWLQSRLDDAGPFFSGSTFGYLDATILPWLLRLFVIKHYRGFEPKGVEKLLEYVERARHTDIVKKSLLLSNPDLTWEEETLQAYLSYGGDVVNYFD
jgi:glutathione S-transferase